MAQEQEITRQTRQASQAVDEERFWPVAGGVFLLGAFLAGTFVAYLPWEAAPWYASAKGWLYALPAIASVSIAVLLRAGNRTIRRSLQLSFVLSLVVHLVLFVVSVETPVLGRLGDVGVATDRPAKPRERVLESQYESFQLESQGSDNRNLFRPVTSESPDPEASEVNRQVSDARRSPNDSQPVVVPETAPELAGHVIPKQMPAETLPQQGEEPSKLSRQVVDTAEVLSGETKVADSPSGIPPPAPDEPSPLDTVAGKQDTTRPVAEPTRVELQVPNEGAAARLPMDARRTEMSALPNVDSPAARREALRGADPMAEIVAHPTRIDTPSSKASSQETGQRLAEPPRMALSRSAVGGVGTDRLKDSDRSLPAAAGPATLALGSARRRELLQPGPPESARSPSDLVRVRRPVGGGSVPGATRAESPTDSGIPAETRGLSDLVGPQDVGPLARQAAKGTRGEIPLPEAEGRLGAESALQAGVNSRRTQRESMQFRPSATRFLRRDIGGELGSNTRAAIPTEAFRHRASRTSEAADQVEHAGPGPPTEKAIEQGLVFLSQRQLSDGRWSLQSAGEQPLLASDTAATGLALLAFQGAGYNHREDPYAAVVAAGIRYLLANQKADGDVFVPADEASNRSAWLYSHSIAALALCEAFGMTQDSTLRRPAQRAIDFIAASQDQNYGGWRYAPGVGSDTSVSGWMMMALKSGELAGLDVPAQTYELIHRWLDSAQAGRGEQHLYRYNPFAPDTPSQRHGRAASLTMTAVGLLMRLHDGWRRDRDVMVRGADYLRQNLPDIGTQEQPERDTYYWYYGTQVMFHMGGKHWEDWNGRLHPLLVNSQVQEGDLAGSWHPALPVPDRWGPQAGRLYVTALNLLSLEVYYRHLPLYDNTAR